MYIYTDSGRLTRPLYYLDNGKLSYGNKQVLKLLHDDKYSWENVVSGFKDKSSDYQGINRDTYHDVTKMYSGIDKEMKNLTLESLERVFSDKLSVVDYLTPPKKIHILLQPNQTIFVQINNTHIWKYIHLLY